MLKLLLAFLFLMGCQGQPKVINNYYTYPAYYSQYDSDVRDIVMDFEVDAAIQNSGASIKMIKSIKLVEGEIVGKDPANPLPLTVIAICQKQDNNTNNYIQIEMEWWYEANDYERKQVLYHELGHCSSLLLDHYDKQFNWACGTGYSIMKSNAVPGFIIQRCWPSMVKELFSHQAHLAEEQDDCSVTGECTIEKQKEPTERELAYWSIITYVYLCFFVCFVVWMGVLVAAWAIGLFKDRND